MVDESSIKMSFPSNIGNPQKNGTGFPILVGNDS